MVTIAAARGSTMLVAASSSMACPARGQSLAGTRRKVRALSTESIASTAQPPQQAGEGCANCGAPLAGDQRYCLECGERRVFVSDFLRSGLPRAAADSSPAPATPPLPARAGGGSPGRSSSLSLLAGVGVLLLAMGVGVLIGRSGGGSGKPAPAQVITVGSTGGGTGTSAGGEETFTGDWPAGTKGFTVELETLPTSGTSVASVNKAKTAAGGKGAGAVGVLKSEEFSSLPAGSYVIYSGVYHKRSEAQKALGSLKKNFPGAKVVEVAESSSSGSGTGAGTGESTGSSGSSGGSSSKAGSSKALEELSHAKGKSYVEKAKNLPDVVSTG